MLEEQVSSLPLEEQKVDLSFNAFEVKTIRCGLS
jgi:hypothetical protein